MGWNCTNRAAWDNDIAGTGTTFMLTVQLVFFFSFLLLLFFFSKTKQQSNWFFSFLFFFFFFSFQKPSGEFYYLLGKGQTKWRTTVEFNCRADPARKALYLLNKMARHVNKIYLHGITRLKKHYLLSSRGRKRNKNHYPEPSNFHALHQHSNHQTLLAMAFSTAHG